MILTPEQEKAIRETFMSIYDTKMEVKALNQTNTDMLKSLAETLQVEKCDIMDAYKYWVKKTQKKKGSIENVDLLFSAVFSAKA